MKTAIVYVSEHHGNTKKLVDAIASAAQVDVIDAAQVGRAALDDYELIGFASGVAFGKYYRSCSSSCVAICPRASRCS